MALQLITGQPVKLGDTIEDSFTCKQQGKWCVVYSQEDSIMFEVTQTPCGDNLVLNGEFADGSEWTFGSDWVIDQGKATHLVGTAGTIYQPAYAGFDASNYFKLTLTVTGMSAGSLDTGFGVTITQNGTYNIYLYYITDDLVFTPTSDFDGSISLVSSYKLLAPSEITALLIDADGGTIGQFTTDVVNEFMIFRYFAGFAPEGCCSVVLVDPCAYESSFTEAFIDNSFDNPSDWTVTSAVHTASITGGAFKQVAAIGAGISYASQPFDFAPTDSQTIVEYELHTGTITNAFSVGIYFYDGGTYTYFAQFLAAGNSNHIFKGQIVLGSYVIDPSNVDMGVYIETPAGGAGSINELTYVSLKRSQIGDTGVYNSNCLAVRQDVTGLQLVEGKSNELESLGFYFKEDNFWLRMRLALSFVNPHIPIKTENNLFSSGVSKKAYAQVGKQWDLLFHEADENAHDTIANIINCDQFLINGNEYITDEKEYTANYGPKGANLTGESTIEVARYNGTRFNNNV